MKIPFILLFSAFILVSCGGSKNAVESQQHTGIHIPATAPAVIPVEAAPDTATVVAEAIPAFSPLVKEVIRTAMSYHGTRYKFGGTSNKGMDCSGLIYTSFESIDIPLQRTSSGMASQGEEIPLREVQKGDLLFFTTGGNRSRINHVGLVVEVENGEIRFIHATTSRGVLVSSLREGYWNHAFHHARRII